MNTGICQYFRPTTRLPSHKDTGIREVAIREANGGVKRVLEKQASQQSAKKRKRHTNFSNTDRAEIGRYTAEYGNAAVQQHFKAKFPNLGESTVRSFKTKYLAAIARGETVSKIPSKKTGRPLTLGEIDGDVQNYVKSMREIKVILP